MTADKIRLVNSHGVVLGEAEVDIGNLSQPSMEAVTTALTEGFNRAGVNPQSNLSGLSSSSTDEEIEEALKKTFPEEKMLPIVLEVLSEHLAEELHKELRSLTDSVVNTAVSEPEIKFFLQGLLAGSREVSVRKIRVELNGEK